MQSEIKILHTTKKILLLLIALFYLSGCDQARLQSAGTGINSYPALWKVQTNQSTLFLFGSIHSLPPQVKWYGDKIKHAFNAADELVVESLPGSEDEKFFRKIERKYGFLKGGKVISDYLTKKEYVTYQEIVKKTGLDKYKADRMQPWLFFMIVHSLVNQENSRYGVDRLLYRKALSRRIKISGLETPYQQVESLAAEPISLQIKNLKKALNAKKINPQTVKRHKDLLLSWMLGDTVRTAKIVADTSSTALYNSLIVKRNNYWYPKIKSYLAKNLTTMLVVGQAHLIGRGNIIDKLRDAGFKVQRLQ